MTPDEWQSKPLGRLIAAIAAGVSVNSESRPRGLGEFGVLKTSAVTYGVFRPEQNKVVLPTEIDRLKESPVAGSVLVSRMNTEALVGAAAYVPENFADLFLPDRIWQCRPDPAVADGRWLHQLLSSPPMRRRLSEIAGGTSGSMKNIAQSRFLALSISAPPLPEQRKIATILSSVDDAIEATQAIIDQLQVVKKAMMAELLTRGLPGRHTRFKQTEIGNVPEEWALTSLGALTQHSAFGPRFPSTLYGDIGNVGSVRTTDISDDWEIDYTTVPRATLDPSVVAPHRLVDGDLLVSRSGTCGVTVVFRAQAVDMVPAAFLIRFRLQNTVDPEFVRLAMMEPSAQARVQSLAAGGVQKNLSGTNLSTLVLPLPPLAEQIEIVAAVAIIDARLRAERRLHKQQKEAKSALMSALLSGEVRVKVDEAAA